MFHDEDFAFFGIVGDDGGELDAVEGSGFDHGVVGHVGEGDAIAGGEWIRERPIADDIAGQARHAAELVGMGKYAWQVCADDIWPVGHFEHVWHMCGDGGVENGNGRITLQDIEDLGDEPTAVKGNGLAGFEVNADIIFGAEFLDEADQAFAIIIRSGDVVAAAEVDPLHVRDPLAEPLLKAVQGFFQVVAILFAQGMEVEAVDTVEGLALKFGAENAKAGIGGAGIVEGGVTGADLGIDAQADRNGARMRSDFSAEAVPLLE